MFGKSCWGSFDVRSKWGNKKWVWFDNALIRTTIRRVEGSLNELLTKWWLSSKHIT